MISPYKGRFRVSQIYKGPAHKGLDLVGIDDKKIYSTVTGVVEAAWHDNHPTGGMGLYVRIRGDGTNYRFYFAHLSKALVKAGQRVKIGEPIGIEGSTGHSTGSHLHYEVRTEPNNETYLDISKICEIPNELGTYEEAGVDIKDTVVTIGSAVVKAKLIGGVTYTPLRETIDAIKDELEVTWDKAKGAGIEL